jgi:hypothetical protein
MKNKNDVIKLLEYGMEHPEGATKSQMLDKVDVEEDKIEELWREIRNKRHDPNKYRNNKISDLFYIIHKKDIDEPDDPEFFNKAKISLNVDGFFRLLQYQEVNEARESADFAKISAKKAQRTAIIAIIIGASVGLFQIIYTLCTTQ